MDQLFIATLCLRTSTSVHFIGDSFIGGEGIGDGERDDCIGIDELHIKG